jgi:colicin import membrane protein
MLISWLLKFEGYPPGVVVALLVHGILLYVILPNKFDPADMVTIQPASYAVASTVKQSPQQLRRIQRLTSQRQNEEADRQRQRQAAAERERQASAERERQAEAERQKQAQAQRQREADAERQRVAEENERREAEQERQRQADAERERQAEAQRQQQVAQQREAEAAAAAAANAAAQQQQSVENQIVGQYMGLIQDLVSRSWTRPPGARNGMTAVVELRLTPTGEVVDRRIIQSSGNAAFDSSVLAAVDRVGTFSELQDMPPSVFERYFRVFNLVFSPEDLLR